jgi:hypothetical protein
MPEHVEMRRRGAVAMPQRAAARRNASCPRFVYPSSEDAAPVCDADDAFKLLEPMEIVEL